MRPLPPLLRRHGFDLLIVLGAVAGTLEVALGDDPAKKPDMATWLAAPIVAVTILTLLARRRFPFGAPGRRREGCRA